jgi:hypothetical protein
MHLATGRLNVPALSTLFVPPASCSAFKPPTPTEPSECLEVAKYLVSCPTSKEYTPITSAIRGLSPRCAGAIHGSANTKVGANDQQIEHDFAPQGSCVVDEVVKIFAGLARSLSM